MPGIAFDETWRISRQKSRKAQLSSNGFDQLAFSAGVGGPVTTHIALRTSKNIRVGDKSLSVIDEHNQAFETEGCVAFGKFGSAMSQRKLDMLLDQIRRKEATDLVLIQKVENDFLGFSAFVIDVQLAGSRQVKEANSPAYYQYIKQKPSMIFMLGSLIRPITNLDEYVLDSSRRSLVDTMKVSRTSMMLVRL